MRLFSIGRILRCLSECPEGISTQFDHLITYGSGFIIERNKIHSFSGRIAINSFLVLDIINDISAFCCGSFLGIIIGKEPAKTESYKVSIEDPENGLIAFPVSENEVVKADMENPQKSLEEALKLEQKKSKKFEEGSEVQVSIAPDSGYYLVSAELLDKEGKKIQDLEVSEEGTAAFTMPESEAKITASFEAYTDEQLDQMDEEGSAAFEEELTDEEIAQIEANSGGSANEAAVCSDDSNVSAQSARIAGSKSIYLNVPGCIICTA